MENKLFLNCSLYSTEKIIPLYDDKPEFKASNISEDNIYEDAAYTGRIVLESIEEPVQNIEIMLNNSKIGNVYFDADMQTISGTICFDEDIPGIAQPFLLQCDMLELSVKIKLKDDNIINLYAPYLLCVSKNEEDTENAVNMLNELLNFDEEKINKWIFYKQKQAQKPDALIQGSMRQQAYKSISSYIQLINMILNCYKNNSMYFRLSSRHSITTIHEMKQYSEMRRIGQKDFLWLTHNLEQLGKVDFQTAIQFDGDNYLPLNILSENKRLNYNIYENRVVVSFLDYLLSDVIKLQNDLKKIIANDDDIYRKLRQVPIEGYHAPIITVKRFQNNYIKSLDNDLEHITKELKYLIRQYNQYLPCEKITFMTYPRKTKIFQEVKPYRCIYDMIIKWFDYGDVNLEKEKTVFRLKTMDKLFEYYCLQQLLKMLHEHGYCINDTQKEIRFFEYNVNDSRYENESDVANTYVLKGNEKEITLYYQPVIYSDGYENGLELYRTTCGNRYYTPDFVMRISSGEKKYYLILDAKYSDRTSIIKYRLKECIMRYGVETESLGEKTCIRMVWLLQGRVDNTQNFYYYNKSPNAMRDIHKKSYGIVSVNTKTSFRARFWREILNICV